MQDKKINICHIQLMPCLNMKCLSFEIFLCHCVNFFYIMPYIPVKKNIYVARIINTKKKRSLKERLNVSNFPAFADGLLHISLSLEKKVFYYCLAVQQLKCVKHLQEVQTICFIYLLFPNCIE